MKVKSLSCFYTPRLDSGSLLQLQALKQRLFVSDENAAAGLVVGFSLETPPVRRSPDAVCTRLSAPISQSV